MMRRFACLLLTFALAKPLFSGPMEGCASQASTAAPSHHETMAVMVMGGEEPISSATPCEECTTTPGEPSPCDHSSPVGACASMGSCIETLAVVDVSALMSPTQASGVHGGTALAPEVPTASPESPPPRA